jgi:hypothetical protein
MREMIEEMVDEIMDQDGDVVIGNLTFRRSYIVRELDPIAYRERCNDLADAMISDLQDELDRLDPEVDAEEIADIQERIDMLESI